MRTFSYNFNVSTLLALFVMVLLLASPSTLLAQPNPQMNYQGKLTNASGVAVPDGQYNMKFWLLASSTAATSTALWAESRLTTNRVTVVNGLFSIMLGEVATLSSVDFNQSLYLGVEIGGISTSTPVWDGEMSPRKILGTVPAAFEAQNAQTLGDIATTSFLRSDQADTMEATSTSALLSLIQNGAGKVLSLFRGVTEIFTVLNNGNVGIGSSTPSASLTVGGTAGVNPLLIASSTGASLFTIFQNGNVSVGSTTAQGKLSVFTNGTDGGFRVQSLTDGVDWFSVGAGGAGLVKFNEQGGTTEVAGSGALGARFNIGSLTSGSNILALSGISGQTGDLFRVDTFGTGGNQFVIKANGNVGIGITSPLTGLAVLEGISSPGTTTVGFGNEIFGQGAFTNSNAEGGYNTVLGYNAGVVNGATYQDENVVIGAFASTTGGASTVIGNRAFGVGVTTLVGYGNRSEAEYSTALGVENLIDVASGNAIAIGYGNLISHTGSAAIGWGNSSTQAHELSFGSRNTASSTPSIKLVGSTDLYQGQNLMRILTSWIDSTDATRKGRVTLTAFDTAEREFIRAETTGSGVNTSFLGGSVAIGTSTPWAKLAIQDTYGSSATLFDIATTTSAGGATSSLFRVTPNRAEFTTGISIINAGTMDISGYSIRGYNGLEITGDNSIDLSSGGNIFVSSASNFGIGTSTPGSKLTVAGDTYIGGALNLTGAFKDSANATGTLGMVLQTTGTSTRWVATSTLGFTGGTSGWSLTGDSGTNPNTNFLGTTDAQSLSFRVNNTSWGSLQNTSKSVFFGESAGRSNASSTSDLYSIGIGYQTFGTTTGSSSGVNNVAIGNQSLFNNTSGEYNSAVGFNSMLANTTGSFNQAFGSNALLANTTGGQNSAFGRRALQSNTAGFYNTAIGNFALSANTTADSNTALGYSALFSNTTGENNIGIGVNAFGTTTANNTGSGNTAIGGEVLSDNLTGNYNTAVGATSLRYNTTGSQNSAFGVSSLYRNTTGSNNQAFGYFALRSNTTGENNIGIGYSSFGTTTANNTGDDNIAFGYQTLFDNTTGYYNVAIGRDSLTRNVSGDNNVAIGMSSLSTATSSGEMVAIGVRALSLNTSGYWGVAVGHEALRYNTSGHGNTAVGYRSLNANTTGYSNLAVGTFSLTTNTTGRGNSALGVSALEANTTGLENTAVGQSSLEDNITGIQNSALGYRSLYALTTGNYNSAFGYHALNALTATSSSNTAVGRSAGTSQTFGDNNIFLGYNTAVASTTGSNQLSIGNLIYGTGLGTSLGYVGIGTSSPQSRLDITNSATSSAIITLRDVIGNVSMELRAGTSTLLNTFIGTNAGASNTTGSQNVSIGRNALQYNTTGSNFTAVGYNALANIDSGSAFGSSAFGSRALQTATSSGFNSAFGYAALRDTTSGGSNSAFGSGAMSTNTTGGSNSAFGMDALNSNTTGSENTAFGREALDLNTTGAINVAVGAYSLRANTTGDGNTGLGKSVLNSNTTGSFNSAVGYNALYSLSTSSYNSAFGYRAGYTQTFGDNNIFLGYDTSVASTTGSNQLSIGNLIYGTGLGTSLGYVGIGTSSPQSRLDITNSATSSAIITLRDVIGNVSMEIRAGTSTLYSTFVGTNAGQSNTSGTQNSFFGSGAGQNVTNGYNNAFFGMAAGQLSVSGGNNTFVGYSAGNNNDGNGNTFVGQGAGQASNAGNYNSFFGQGAGYNTEGAGNLFLGHSAATSSTLGNYNIALGYAVQLASTTGSNQLNIGNLLYGTGLGISTTAGTGNIGIGTSTPEGKLSIANTSFSTAGGVAGIDQYFSLTNSTNAAVQYGNRSYIYATNTATTTIVGSMYRLADSTTFGNTVRGLEVQVDKGNNTRGENTALSGFARTFGVRGTTIGDAGGTYEPAGVYGETQGTTQGNAIRGYSSTITTAALLKLFQDTSAYVGTGLLMNFGNSGGSFSSTTASKFIDLQNAGTSMFTVGAYGKLTIGDGTTSNNAGIQVGYGGICVDNDGSCNASTTGRVSAVSYHTGNSDLAEVYFSDENLKTGEVVYLKGGLSVGRASEDNKEKVIGVVTTKPGLLLGFDDTSLEAGEEGYGVALAGRVPVRLSNENGEIKTGDELMLSSIAGVVMKASSTGKVVGVALEDFEENRAYSDTYINQFGDDLVDPVVTPISASNDPRMNDGCYYGAGNASGEAPCVPLVATTTDAQVAEAQALAEAEAQAEALAALANVSSKRVTLDNGEEVKVGQIVMFVDLKERYLDEAGKDMVAALLSSPESSAVIDGVSETVWTRLVTLANNFVDGVLSVFTLKADRVEVKDELCVDGVCLNAEDIRQLLENSGGSVEEESAPEEPPVEEEGGGGEEEPPAEGTEEGGEGEEMVGDESGGGEETGGEQTGNEEEGGGEEETTSSEGGEEEPGVEENPTPEEPAPEPEPTPEPAP